MIIYLLRVARAPREGDRFPRQEITLLDLSRAIAVMLLGAEQSRMWTELKGRHVHHAA